MPGHWAYVHWAETGGGPGLAVKVPRHGTTLNQAVAALADRYRARFGAAGPAARGVRLVAEAAKASWRLEPAEAPPSGRKPSYGKGLRGEALLEEVVGKGGDLYARASAVTSPRSPEPERPPEEQAGAVPRRLAPAGERPSGSAAGGFGRPAPGPSPREILAECDALLRSRPSDLSVQRKRVELLLRAKRHALALEGALQVVEPEAPSAWWCIMVGDAYLGLKEYEEALSMYDRAIPLLKNGGQWDGPQDQGHPEALIKLRCSKALHSMDAQDVRSFGASLVMEVVQADQTDTEGLLQYAAIALDQGMARDCLKVTLRLLLKDPDHRGVRRKFVEGVRATGTQGLVEEIFDATAGGAGATASNLAKSFGFLATVLKEHGAIDAAADLFARAVQQESSIDLRLAQAHTAELQGDYVRALEVAVEGLRRDAEELPGLPSLVAELTGMLGEWNALRSPQCVLASKRAPAVHLAGGEIDAAADVLPVEPWAFSATELKLLATLMLAVKVCYLCGAFPALPGLCRGVAALKRLCTIPPARTPIRNENAYFVCVEEIVANFKQGLGGGAPSQVDGQLGVVLRATREAERPLYLVGDSHCLSAAWRAVSLPEGPFRVVPVLVTGLKHWHLRAASRFYTKWEFHRKAALLPERAKVVFLFGEIDCREGLPTAVAKLKHATVPDAIRSTCAHYVEALLELAAGKAFEVYVHPIPPVLDETRDLVTAYNAVMEDMVRRAGERGGKLRWLNFAEALVADGKLEAKLGLDGTHLGPLYVGHMERAFQAL